jgi:hypothetical protein
MQKMRGAFLVGAAILVLPLMVGAPAPAIAQRIGITSAVTGDPTGKPPDEIERVLRVGIDVTAGEVVTTGAADRAHLLFLDGTALTISNQAQVTLDRFVYDADQKLGDLAITATKGVFRLVGGRISKKTPVNVVTPSATLTIRGGIAMFSVEPTKTIATFIFGYEMTMTSQGRTRSVTAPGFQISTRLGQAPGPAMRPARGSLADNIGRLEAGAGAGAGRPGSGADGAAKATGFADSNSGKGPNAAGPVQGGPAPHSPATSNGPGGQPRMGGPGIGGGGFDPGIGPAPLNTLGGGSVPRPVP